MKTTRALLALAWAVVVPGLLMIGCALGGVVDAEAVVATEVARQLDAYATMTARAPVATPTTEWTSERIDGCIALFELIEETGEMTVEWNELMDASNSGYLTFEGELEAWHRQLDTYSEFAGKCRRTSVDAELQPALDALTEWAVLSAQAADRNVAYLGTGDEDYRLEANDLLDDVDDARTRFLRELGSVCNPED